ncbi:MAG: 4Fe-4S dicluster domain-containing protein [Eubacteriales bacterium]|nr:4Fe-4S dicluster domain-containing protein [Eubacteriales bacterium]
MLETVERIRAAGLVGMGGAGFPTHAKLNAKISHIIINGMECEPLLCADRYIMRHMPDSLVTALVRIKGDLGAENATFCLKEEYTEEAAALEGAIARAHAPVGIHKTVSFYPAGDEHVVVYEVTGRAIPPMDIPLSVGCVVMNVGTLLAAFDALEGRPLTARYVTVTGEVRSPAILKVPIGTSFADCLGACGGVTRENVVMISGGPMMGKSCDIEAAGKTFVGKTTSAILVLPGERYRAASLDMRQIKQRASAACIQCSYCTQLCPRYLLGHPLEPHRIMRKLAYGNLEDLLDDPVLQSAALCSECGLCEVYACPMGLQPRSVNALIKREMAKEKIRFPKPVEYSPPHPMRESRLAPTKRVAARVGVLPYEGAPLEKLISLESERVELSLRQGIGAPSAPLVSAGTRVVAGQLIAACPEDKLGADLHASIDGIVREVGESIVIVWEGSV